MAGSRRLDSQAPLSAQVFQILLSLIDADMHGYALIQDIRERTRGEISLTASTLYAATKRLLAAGWIDEIETIRPRRITTTVAAITASRPRDAPPHARKRSGSSA